MKNRGASAIASMIFPQPASTFPRRNGKRRGLRARRSDEAHGDTLAGGFLSMFGPEHKLHRSGIQQRGRSKKRRRYLAEAARLLHLLVAAAEPMAGHCRRAKRQSRERAWRAGRLAGFL